MKYPRIATEPEDASFTDQSTHFLQQVLMQLARVELPAGIAILRRAHNPFNATGLDVANPMPPTLYLDDLIDRDAIGRKPIFQLMAPPPPGR